MEHRVGVWLHHLTHWGCQSDVIPWGEGGREGGREGDMDSICTCRIFCNGNDYAIFSITIQYAKSDIYMYMKHNTCTVGIN